MAPITLTDEVLVDYAAGTLDENQRQAVEAALQEQPEARATVERYRTAAVAVATDDTVEPPAHVIEQARAIFQPAPRSAGRHWLDVVDAVVAKVVFDSRRQPAGTRVANTGRTVQVTYATDDVEVDLQASRSRGADGARWRVMGQFACESEQDELEYAVFAAGSTEPVVEDTHGVEEPFTVELPSGRYEVRARIGGAVIVLPELVLE